LGLWDIRLESTFDSPLHRSLENQRDRHAIPHFSYTFSREDVPFSFVFGAFAPFGLSARWPNDTGFRTVATQGTIEYITLNPVIAWKVQPSSSLGAGLTFTHVHIDLQRGLFWPDQAYDSFKYTGGGWDVGFNLGVLWKAHEKVSLGVSYRSETSVDLEGETEYHNAFAVHPVSPAQAGIPAFPQQKVNADARFPFPSVLIIGVSLLPTPKWNLAVNADYANWDRLRSIAIEQQKRI
jgi:long-chain fatty acid transport protein